MFPLDNSHLAAVNADRKLFFDDEDAVRNIFFSESGLSSAPKSLEEYLRTVVTPALERHKQGGAIAEKFEVAYLRPFGFEKVERTAAEKVYSTYVDGKTPPDEEYKILQDYLFRFMVVECGRLGLVVHIHAALGAGGYFDVRGVNPLLLEPLFNDPDLRKTNFVMLHGGWPYTREITSLLTKPNAYLDFSIQPLLLTAPTVAASLRQWLEFLPEKVLFGTDASPYNDALGWEESGWIASRRGREALAIALTGMMRDGEISQERAMELARMVLRENAQRLYGF
jgi:predicted TIM-barrel fold metal-dependent hydrolase